MLAGVATHLPIELRGFGRYTQCVRVLVTGGSGFIGSWVARAFADAGHETRIMRRDDSHALPAALKGVSVETHLADLGDPEAIAKAAEECTHVVHAAGRRHGTHAELGWANVAGTENVLNAASHAGVRRVVAISCADVTMTKRIRVNWNEDRVLTGRPLGSHAFTMNQAEERVIGAGKAEFETVVLRPALVWGAGDSRIDEWLDEGRGKGLPLYGRGESFVATTHVENLAHCALLAATAEDAAGSVFHVVDDELNLARDYFEDLSRALDLPDPRKSWLPFAAHFALASEHARVELVRRCRSHSFDQQRAIQTLGYTPKVSLTEGMARLSAWQRSRTKESA